MKLTRVYKTRTGQPYIKLKSGKAKFISKKSARLRRGTTKRRSAPKKRARRRSKTMARRKKSRGRKTDKTMSALKAGLLGAGAVVLYEAYVSPKIPLQGTAKQVLEIAGGAYLASKKKGVLGYAGKALIVTSSVELLRGLDLSSLIQGGN